MLEFSPMIFEPVYAYSKILYIEICKDLLKVVYFAISVWQIFLHMFMQSIPINIKRFHIVLWNNV